MRALIRDLGQLLNTGGCLTGLTRAAVGPFDIDKAWTFEAIEQASGPDYLVRLEQAQEMLVAPPRIPARPAQ